MGKWYKDKFWFDYLCTTRNRVDKLELKIAELTIQLCPHKTLVQKDKDSSWLTCSVCGEWFIEKSDGCSSHNVAPKGSTICKYKCELNK